MKITRPRIFLFTLVCVWLTRTAVLGGELTPFEVFQSLKGSWMIQAGDKTLPFQMTYDVQSHATIVTEQFGKELSVFCLDGGSFLMTHFCNRGNQPRLKLKSGGPAGSYEFDMFDITNLKNAADPHVQRIIYQILDPQHMNLEIIWKKGADEESEKYILTKRP
jgi:hypothetical protein